MYIYTHTHTHTHIHTHVVPSISFQTFFVQAFKIVIDA